MLNGHRLRLIRIALRVGVGGERHIVLHRLLSRLLRIGNRLLLLLRHIALLRIYRRAVLRLIHGLGRLLRGLWLIHRRTVRGLLRVLLLRIHRRGVLLLCRLLHRLLSRLSGLYRGHKRLRALRDSLRALRRVLRLYVLRSGRIVQCFVLVLGTVRTIGIEWFHFQIPFLSACARD